MQTGKAKSEGQVKRIELWVAVITLVGAIVGFGISTYKDLKENKKLQQVGLVIKDTNDLRASLRKPLEGRWTMRIDFSSYFGNPGRWYSMGDAVMSWDPSARAYEVLLGYSVNSDRDANEKVVTGVIKGRIAAPDDSGWPTEPFDLTLNYVARTTTSPSHKLDVNEDVMRGLRLVRSPEGRVLSFTGDIVLGSGPDKASSGRAQFSRKD